MKSIHSPNKFIHSSNDQKPIGGELAAVRAIISTEISGKTAVKQKINREKSNCKE